MISNTQFFTYLLLMALTTYLLRAVPFFAFSKKIKNRVVRSFLYYIPYTVLTVMTLPAALYATGSVVAAAIGLVAAVVVAIKSKNLLLTALTSCTVVLIIELLLK